MKCFLNRDYVENFIRYHKKTIIKVVAGFVLFATAFFVFCIRDDKVESNEFKLINGSDSDIQSQSDSDIQSQNKIIEIVTSKSIDIKEEISKPQKIYVDISGAVENPYVYEMEEGTRVYEVIELAGGLKEDADISNLNLAQILKDEDKITISTKSQISNGIAEESIKSSNSLATSNIEGEYGKKDEFNSEKLININTATAMELQNITGIGPSTADKIISYREEHGDFKKIEDIMNVNGIGEKTFTKFKNKIMV